MPQVHIPITEEFDEPAGEFTNYDAIPLDQRTQLSKQKHTNIRSFIGDATTVYLLARDVYMLFMDTLFMKDLATIKVSELDATVTVKEGEQWSVGTYAKDPSRKNWPVLTVPCTTAAPTLTASILRQIPTNAS